MPVGAHQSSFADKRHSERSSHCRLHSGNDCIGRSAVMGAAWIYSVISRRGSWISIYTRKSASNAACSNGFHRQVRVVCSFLLRFFSVIHSSLFNPTKIKFSVFFIIRLFENLSFVQRFPIFRIYHVVGIIGSEIVCSREIFFSAYKGNHALYSWAHFQFLSLVAIRIGPVEAPCLYKCCMESLSGRFSLLIRRKQKSCKANLTVGRL